MCNYISLLVHLVKRVFEIVSILHAYTCTLYFIQEITLLSFFLFYLFSFFFCFIPNSPPSLSLSQQMPIDTLLFQCDVPVDLQEVERSTAVMSYSPPNPKVRLMVVMYM